MTNTSHRLLAASLLLSALILPFWPNITTMGPNFCHVDYTGGQRIVTGWTASGIPCDVLYPEGIDPP